MRILCMIDHFGAGGAQRQMVTLAVRLAGRGHTVEFFIYHPDHAHLAPIVEEAGLTVHVVRKAQRFSTKVFRRLRSLVADRGYDVILAYLDTPGVYAELLKLTGLKTPIVVSERSMFTGGRLSPGQWIKRQLHRLADHVVVNSHHQRERMQARFPWMAGRLSTILNGVDLERFHPPELDQQHERPRLLAVGTIRPSKNFDALIEALNLHRAQHGWAPTLHWAGRLLNYPEDQKAYAEAKAKLSRYGLDTHWTWLGERQDIPDLLRSFDAVIHPSYLEGFSNVVCEALASGRAVLASRAFDHPLLIREAETGYLFDPHDPEDIARVLQVWASHSLNERVEVGRNARRFAEAELSDTILATRYEALFRRLTSAL